MIIVQSWVWLAGWEDEEFMLVVHVFSGCSIIASRITFFQASAGVFVGTADRAHHSPRPRYLRRSQGPPPLPSIFPARWVESKQEATPTS